MDIVRSGVTYAIAGACLFGVASQPSVAQAPAKATPPPAFTASAESLKNYKAPDWFRDAKFGIWSHWGPQSVPRQGDWYARRMYLEGDKDYKHHLATYGHPSLHGYKDIIPLWKAEKWNPDQLMDLYVKAGAKYFVSMGVHHDNFDLWNSKYHTWNAVKMGPHRDVVGEWQKAARKRGLRFGVSEHLGASFDWFQASRQSDKTGPLAGVPYDGANPKYQELYHSPKNPPLGPGPWYTTVPQAQQEWFRRIQDLVDTYQPDLLYSDGGIPFGNVGRSMMAHLYNESMTHHKGRLEAVYTSKRGGTGSGESIDGANVLDIERGGLQNISPEPWQTDTSIGDWFYSEGYHYKTADEVIHTLADIVSKNGNLLINVVQYPDGSLPPESQQFLTEMAQWMPVNGEAIYGTRPWTIFGEGPTQIRAGSFREDFPYTARDIRFTTKKNVLYAITLGVPTGHVIIKSLALGSPLVTGEASSVELLGYKNKLQWSRTEDGLVIQIPPADSQQLLKHGFSFKITGFETVAGVEPAQLASLAAGPDKTVEPNAADGSLVLLPKTASLHGETIQVQGDGPNANIGFWNNAQEWVSWDKVSVSQAGTYRVSVETSTLFDQSDFVVEIAGRKLPAKAASTGDWNTFKTLDLGEVEITRAGTVVVSVRAATETWKAINLRAVRLQKIAR